jgi:NTP pyrophosphatase (non-canonical NTP hydrolase)
MNLSFDELREANVTRCEQVFHALNDWTPTDWACAMAGEAGEACNEVKKLRRLDGADAEMDTAEERHWLKVKIAHEIADLIIYADLLAARLEIDLAEAVRYKFNEVSDKRKSTVKL